MGLEANIRHVTPYVPGEQPRQKVIKLNTNENPYPPAPGAMEMLHQMDPEKLRMYPDPEIKMLTECLASRYQVRPEQVFVGVGSDDVLAMSFLTFFNSGKPVLFPDITYSFYKVWAELYRVPYTCPSLDGTMHIRAEDYCGENGGIILANPNAPTGLYESLDVIEKILKENPGVVVIVDEAYIDFAGKPSAVSLVDRYENLLVTQTFSKSRSMAGVRIGIIATRERTKRRMAALGFEFPDSSANFLFARHPKYDGEVLFQALRQRQIYVRHWNQSKIREYLRITIGTEEEMETLYEALEEILKS